MLKEICRNPTGFGRCVEVAKSSDLCYIYAIGDMGIKGQAQLFMIHVCGGGSFDEACLTGHAK